MATKYARHPVETCIGALRSLSKTNDVNRSELIKKNIDLCLSGGEKDRLLDGLRSAIDNEDSERRDGEGWTFARKYVPSLMAKCSDVS
jgi:hypothetical protein